MYQNLLKIKFLHSFSNLLMHCIIRISTAVPFHLAPTYLICLFIDIVCLYIFDICMVSRECLCICTHLTILCFLISFTSGGYYPNVAL